MLQNIPAMCYIIPLPWLSLNYPICKQDAKGGMRRSRAIFPKPPGGLKVKPLAPGPEFALLCYAPQNPEFAQVMKNVAFIPKALGSEFTALPSLQL